MEQEKLSPGLVPVHQNMMFLMGQLNRQWRKVVDRRLRPLGLTEAMWLPLMHLERATEPTRMTVPAWPGRCPALRNALRATSSAAA